MKRQQTTHRFEMPFHLILSFIAVGLSLLAILVVGFTFFFTSSKFIRERSIELHQKQVSQVSDRISDNLSLLETVARLSTESTQLKVRLSTLLNAQNHNVFLHTELYSDIHALFIQASKILPELHSISLLTDRYTFSSDSRYICSEGQAKFLEHLQLQPDRTAFIYMDEESDLLSLFPPVDQRFYANKYLYICPFEVDGTVLATCLIIVSDQFLTNSLDPHLAMAIVQSGQYVLCNTTNLPQAEILTLSASAQDGSTNYVTFFPGFDLSLLSQLIPPTLETQLSALRLMYLVAGAAILVIALLLSRVFAKPLTGAMKGLENKLSEINNQASLRSTWVAKRPFPRNYIFIYVLSIVISSCILFSFFSYRYFLKSSKSILQTSLNTTFQQSVENTSSLLYRLYYTSFHLGYDDQLQQAFPDETEEVTREISSAFTEDYLRQSTLLYSIPIQLTIFDSDWELLSTTAGIVLDPIILPGNVSRSMQWSYAPSGKQNTVVLSMQIIDLQQLRSVGYMCLQADELYISQAFDYFPNGEHHLFLHNSDGTILSSTNKHTIGSKLPEPDENILLFSQPMENVGLTLTAYYDSSALYTEMNATLRSMLYFFLALLLATLLVGIFICRFLSKQFLLLGDTLSTVSLDKSVVYTYRYSVIREINRTYDALDKMQHRILALMDDILTAENQRHTMEMEKRRSDLLLLQSQINPHFLYNTFESINSMICNGDFAVAMKTLGALADMLRYTTKERELSVPLREEVRYAMLYMEIMQIHSRSLSVTYDISPEAMEKKTVRFILQPILENSILHGFRPKGGAGSIQITGHVSEQALILVIRDDGVGMDRETLERVTRSFADEQHQDSIGLPNIANRLHLIYRSNGHLLLDSEEGYGCVVTIIQPLQ